MGKTDDGGPAFPHSSLAPNKEIGQLAHTMYSDSRGMSVRQYFAAHAPLIQAIDGDGEGKHEPPWWYEHGPRPKWPGPFEQGDKKKQEKINDHQTQCEAWERDQFFAWRWYYADQMLKTGRE